MSMFKKHCGKCHVDFAFLARGIGTMKDFAEQRACRVQRLAAKLHEALIEPDSGSFVARTGSLVRSNTLRTKSTRKAFRTILEASHDPDLSENDLSDTRFWAKRCMLDALKKMVNDNSLQVPQLPGFTWHSWFKKQSSLLHALVKKANRNSHHRPMADADPTLEYNIED